MSAVLINKRIYPFLWKTIVLSTNKRWQVRARGIIIIIIIISETRNGNRSQKRKKSQGRSPRRCLRRLLAPRRRARRRPWRTSDAGPAPRTAGAAAGQGGTGRRRGRRRRRRAGARPWRAPWQQQLRDWVADGGRGESLPNAADTRMDGRVEKACGAFITARFLLFFRRQVRPVPPVRRWEPLPPPPADFFFFFSCNDPTNQTLHVQNKNTECNCVGIGQILKLTFTLVLHHLTSL
jgi:hypothetical protein